MADRRNKLIREIFARAREFHAGRGYDELRIMIHDDLVAWGVSKVPSISKLSIQQLTALAHEYRQRNDGQVPAARPGRDPAQDPLGPVSDEQRRLLDELFEELGMDARARAGFCVHTLKGYLVNRGEAAMPLFYPQDRSQAQAVIEGLKAIKRRRRCG